MPHEHEYIVKQKKDATCEASGYIVYSCKECGDEYIETLTALGHNYGEWTETTPATCTDKGEETRVCSHDNAHIETRDIESIGHDYVAVVTAPTCTEQGYTTYSCSRCDEHYQSNYTAALGHNYEENGAPIGNCALSMKQSYTCARCDDEKNEIVTVQAPDAHNRLNVGATCEYCGWTVYIKNGDSVLMNNSEDKFSAEFYGTGAYSYSFADSLKRYIISAYISDSVKSIGYDAFRDCSGLTSITIGGSVTSIGISIFSGCSGLKSITVLEGNTKYRSEGNCIIERGTNTLILGCKNSVIPDSVTSIGEHAFSGCSGLTSITFKGTKAQWQAISKGSSWRVRVPETVVHCSDGDVNI